MQNASPPRAKNAPAPPRAAIPDPLREGIAALALKLRQGELSALALTESCLSRIEALDPTYRSFVTLAADHALAGAKAADQRLQSGQDLDDAPLLGLPIAVKDMFDIKGLPMTAGMPSRQNAIASDNADVIDHLSKAGGVLLGTLKLAEGVFGEYRPKDQAPVNPWGRDLWPGASSGGSAVAVAMRLCGASIASDTGGSVRMPSAVTGQTGLKATRGRISMKGAFPLAPSFDHVGVIAPSAKDAVPLFQTIAKSRDHAPPKALRKLSRKPGARLTIGIAEDWLRGCNSEVTATLEAATAGLKSLGHRLTAIELPAAEGIAADWYTVAAVELAAVHDYTFNRQPESYGQALATAIRVGRGQDLEALAAARARLGSFAADLRGAMARVDVLALPVFPFPAPSWAEVDTMDEATILALHRYTCPFSISGLPTITLPGGISMRGHPLAVQLAGQAWEEELLLDLAAEFQTLTDWHLKSPSPMTE